MNFFNIPEPPSFEREQNDYSQKSIDLLKEIKKAQDEQIYLVNKIQDDSEKEAKINRKRFIIQTVLSVASLIAAVVAAVAAIIVLL